MMQKRGHAMGLRSLFYLRKVVFYLKILCDAWYKKINSLSLSNFHGTKYRSER